MDSTEDISSNLSELKNITNELESQLKIFENTYDTTVSEIEALLEELEQEKKRAKRQINQVADIEAIDESQLEQFLEKPYTLVPKEENESWVIVPRWIPFNVGYLQKQDESYNHFVVNKYINWISELPDDIQDSVGIEQTFSEEVTVKDSIIEFSDESERDRAWDVLGGRDGGLFKRESNKKIQIKSGKEFEVIAEIIENGNLPFSHTPVSEDSLRSNIEGISLRSYQERAWDKFVETGMIGVYWPPGTGKTFFSLYAGERLRGEKLVVVPQKTLEEQWNERIEEHCEHPEEWTVKTYQYLTYGSNMEEFKDVTLTIYDECHRIPSRTYSKVATIDTKYRIGLTASPYREEKNTTKYIFALTGHPVGLNWEELVEMGVTNPPDVKVLLHRTLNQKVKTVLELAKKPGKTVIFCDDISKGKQLANELDTEFIYGETEDRMDKFRNNRVFVSSRVGDEGLSLPSLRRVIEFDFHGRSRRQELQRAGRVMHNDSDQSTEHIVLMTDEENDKYSDRLLSLEEKGFNINYIRQA